MLFLLLNRYLIEFKVVSQNFYAGTTMEFTDKFRKVRVFQNKSDPKVSKYFDQYTLGVGDEILELSMQLFKLCPEVEVPVLVFEDEYVGSFSSEAKGSLKYQFVEDDDYIFLSELATDSRLLKWTGNRIKRIESRIVVELEQFVDGKSPDWKEGENPDWRCAQILSLGGWCVRWVPKSDRAQDASNQPEAIFDPVPLDDGALRFKWILGDELYVKILPEPGRRGFAMSPFYGRLKWAQRLAMFQSRLRVSRVAMHLPWYDRLLTGLLKLPYWLTRRDGMESNLYGIPSLKDHPHAAEIEMLVAKISALAEQNPDSSAGLSSAPALTGHGR